MFYNIFLSKQDLAKMLTYLKAPEIVAVYLVFLHLLFIILWPSVSLHFQSVGLNVNIEIFSFSQRKSSIAGLHKLWYPVVRDMSTWSKFGAHGEHGDVFLFSNLGAL